MQFIKFGFGRGVRDASRLIQLGHMTRADALEMANRYDDEFPEGVPARCTRIFGHGSW